MDVEGKETSKVKEIKAHFQKLPHEEGTRAVAYRLLPIEEGAIESLVMILAHIGLGAILREPCRGCFSGLVLENN